MKFYRNILSLLVAVTFTANYAMAEEIKSIIVDGNERVETETVLSYVPLVIGGDYKPSQASKIIKSLYGTGLFAHVEVTWDGSIIAIAVTENPLVNRVVFEGNDEVEEDSLKQVIALGPRSVYSPGKIQKDIQELQALYNGNGYFMAKITPQLIKRDQNRVDVIYVIDEGEESEIKRISIVGNKHFSDAELKSVIRSREDAWWRFLTSSVYHPEMVELDKELLRRFYIEHGFADFRVVSGVTELSKDKRNFFITFTVSEGKIYDFGSIDVRIATDDEGLSKEALLAELSIEEGDRYDGTLVEDNIDNLIEYLGSNGFAFLNVNPRFVQDEAANTVGLTFDVVPGPRVYVNRINITGNDRTRDEVIRREMRFAEGDAFSSTSLARSRDRLTYLDFFENVNIRRGETEFPDKIDLNVNVAEKSTGEVNVGAGYSTYEGMLATANVRERNFLGKGQDMLVKFALSSRRQDFNLSFTEPYFMDRELAAGVDLFNERRDLQTQSSYNINKSGGKVRFKFPVDEFTKNTLYFGFKETKIDNVDSGASQFVRRENGKRSSFNIGNIYGVDTRDSYTIPTHGYRASLSADYSGLGSDINYLRSMVSGSWHKRLADDWILSIGGRAGAVWDLGDNLPLYEYYSAGGTNLRGFDYGGIGPRDSSTSDALGGRYTAGHNAEITFPISTEFTELGVNGIIFSDGGIVTGFDDDGLGGVTDTKTYRISAGAGVFWRSPMGPLRFEFGFPIVRAAEDRTQVFNFNFGTRF